MRFGWESRFTTEQLDELRTLVNEVDWTPGTGAPVAQEALTVAAGRVATAPPVGSFLHRLALEF